MNVIEISWGGLAIAAIPMAVIFWIYFKAGLGRLQLLYAALRMTIQLLLIGYLLQWIFASRSPWIVSGILVFMLATASVIATRPLKRSARDYLSGFFSLFVGSGIVYVVIMTGVLHLLPWENPRYAIPLAGMVFANGMNGMSLALERFVSEERSGADPGLAQRKAINACLLPNTNSFLAVGLVAIPGMMTGQILAGVPPVVAVKYQILIMLAVFSSAGISAWMVLRLRMKK